MKMKLKTNRGDVIMEKFGYLVINGQPYKDKTKRGQVIFEKVSKQKFDMLDKEADELAEKLKASLDSKKVLKEALMKIDEKGLHTLYKSVIKKKKNFKAQTREHACVDMQIGNFILPIMD